MVMRPLQSMVAQCNMAKTVVICHQQTLDAVLLNGWFGPGWFKTKDFLRKVQCVDALMWPNMPKYFLHYNLSLKYKLFIWNVIKMNGNKVYCNSIA